MRKSSQTIDSTRDARLAIQDMDCVSQKGLSQIASMARLALARLEAPDGYQSIEDIAQVLSAIWGKAEDIQSCINFNAEEAGAAYIDKSAERRSAAWQAFKNAGRES